MNPIRCFLFYCVLGALTVFAANAATSAPGGALPTDFMPLSEIQVGMELTGKTCFEGSRIEEFKGKIVGVEHGAFADSNLIWALLESPRLGPHSVAAGMSGSPCYIDGRMIGAVAYGYPGGQKPLAGITPIGAMLKVLDLTSDKPHPSEGAEAAQGATVGVWDIEELRKMARSVRPPTPKPAVLEAERLPDSLRKELGVSHAPLELQPLAMPVGISACAPEVYGPLTEFLASCNMSLVTGGIASGTLDASKLPPLEDGSAMGLPMMTGDLSMGGYGTVTYRRGDKLVGFGHPFLEWGDVDVPLSPCSMFMVNASYQETFKVGEIATPVGSIRQDRLHAVGGVIGKIPRILPLTVRVKGVDRPTPQEFHYNIWDNRYFTSMLVGAGVRQSVAAADRSDGDTTLQFEYTIALDGVEPIRKTLFFATSSGPGMLAAYELAGDVALLQLNPFRKGVINSIDAEVKVTSLVHQAAIVSVTADKDVYRPGETVKLTLYIQPYRGAREKRVVDMPLDPSLRDGTYDLFVGDGENRLKLERVRAPGRFTPMNFQQVVDAIRMNYPGNNIYVTLSESDAGLTVHGQEMPSLPPSLRDLMSNSNEGAFILPTNGRILSERVMEGETEFVGSARLALQVSRTGRR